MNYFSNNFTDYSDIWMYQEPFSRVLMESLEVATIICNRELPKFTVAKLFDVMNQIIPTGFVLTTGYWPYYSTSKMQSLCVCGRFSLECRHNNQQRNWIDLDPIPDDYSALLWPEKYGPVLLTPTEIVVSPITAPPVGFQVTLQLKFTYQDNGTTKKSRAAAKKPEIEVTNCSQYILKCQWYPAFRSILFEPNPYYTNHYGFHIHKLLVDRERLEQNPHFNFGTMYVENDIMPQFTVILEKCDQPTYSFPTRFTIAKYNLAEDVQREMEIVKYRQKVSKCKPIWNHQPIGNDITFNFENFLSQLTVNEAQQPNNELVAIEQPPKPAEVGKKRRKRAETPENPQPLVGSPIIIPDENNNEVFKVPPPPPKATRGRKKKFQHLQTFGDTTTTTPRSSYQTNPFPIPNLENPSIEVKIAKNEKEIIDELVELDMKWVEEILQ